jgi:hypothetical protein
MQLEENHNAAVYCKDCKYYHRTFSMWLGQAEARCTHDHHPKVDLVTGKAAKIDFYVLSRCRRERTDEYSSNCGEQGRFWSPRAASPETTMLLLKRKVPNGIN